MLAGMHACSVWHAMLCYAMAESPGLLVASGGLCFELGKVMLMHDNGVVVAGCSNHLASFRTEGPR